MEEQQQSNLPPSKAAAGEAAALALGGQSELERILDIPLTIHVELGRKRLRISELLQVGAGHILELDAAAGTPLSIYANSTLIAHGEAVVVGERYGIRITDIVSPHERVKRLGGK